MLKRFEKFLLWEIGVFVSSPSWLAAEQNARERFFGEILELRAAATLTIFREHGWEVSGLLREDDELRMAIEQCSQQSRSRFCLARDETSALMEWQMRSHRERLHCLPAASRRLRDSFFVAQKPIDELR